MKPCIFKAFFVLVVLLLAAGQVHGRSTNPGEGQQGVTPDEGPSPTPFEENFDSYASGSNMHGQGGWKGWFNNPASGALVSNSFSQSNPNSVQIESLSDLVHEFSGFTSGQWALTAWIYIPGNFSGTSYIIALNSYDDAGVTLNWSLQDQFQSGSGLLVSDATGASVPFLTDQWVEYRAEIDLDANMYSVFYNGAPFYSASWTEGISGGGALNIGAIDLFANGATAVYYDDISLCSPEGCGPEEDPFARFQVSKDFNDNNTASVDVTLVCNTGLPLMQPATIAEGFPVNFVVGDFEQGTLNCTVTEDVPDGYTASYDDEDGVSADNCSWTQLVGGQYTCEITNSLDLVEVEVTKVWIDENPQFNAQNFAAAEWSCSNVIFGNSSGYIDFNGNPDTSSFSVYPDWDGSTTCSITEIDLLESGIEVDGSECQGLSVTPGNGASCTIYNTRLYEGIPTLSQYGLALLALFMLGVGFVAFRRFS